jgi:hypothetical protein
VSYLGREEFAPAEARQAVLQERWGFQCSCERCTVEAAAPPELRATVNDAYARVMRVKRRQPRRVTEMHQLSCASRACPARWRAECVPSKVSGLWAQQSPPHQHSPN